MLGEAFIKNPKQYKFIDFVNDNKDDLSLENLYWTNEIIQNKKELLK